MQRYTKLQVYLPRNESTCLACSCFFRTLVQTRDQWSQKNDLCPPKNFKKSRDLLVIYLWTIRCVQTPWKVWYFRFVYLELQAWGASLILAVIIAPEIFNSEQTKPKLTPFWLKSWHNGHIFDLLITFSREFLHLARMKTTDFHSQNCVGVRRELFATFFSERKEKSNVRKPNILNM